MKVTGLWDSYSLCCHSVVKLPEATQMSVMADCERGMTVKNPVGIWSINHVSICFVCLFVFVS